MDDALRLKYFGENVRRLRISLNMSQEEFAYEAGLDRTYIGGIERGERNVGLLNIIKIANALQVEIKDLFEDIK